MKLNTFFSKEAVTRSPVSIVPLNSKTVGCPINCKLNGVSSQLLQSNRTFAVHDELFPAQSVTFQSWSTISCPGNSLMVRVI